MSTKDDMVSRNVELATEFSHYLFDHPDFESDLDQDAEVVLLPEGDKELRDHNLRTGREMEAAGSKVVYVSIKRMRPRVTSRIEELALVTA